MRKGSTRSLPTGPAWIVLLGASVTLVLSLLVGWAAWGMDQAHDREAAVHRLQETLGAVAALDEGMTRSTRMAAVTQDLEWEERYRAIAVEVDLRMRRIASLSALVEGEAAARRLQAANQRMELMERRAFELVRHGRSEAALELISSEDYNAQKAILTETTAGLAAAAGDYLKTNNRSVHQRMLWSGLLAGVGVAVLLALWGGVFRQLRRHFSGQAASLSLLRATLDSTADGILVVDEAGRTQTYNRRFLKMWGIRDEEVRARDEDALISCVAGQLEDTTAFFAGLQSTLADHAGSQFHVLKLKDGRIFERYSRPQRLGGEVVGRVFSFRDVTERERAEAALLDERRLLEQVLDNLGADVAMLDPDGRFEYINPRTIADDEFREWLMGRTSTDYCRYRGKDPEIGRRRQQSIQRAVRSRSPDDFVERLVAADGEARYFVRKHSPIVSEDGEVLRVVGLGLEVTDEVRAREALRESEAQLREVVEGVQAIIWESDAKTWDFTYISPGVEEILGYPPEQWYDDPDLWEKTLHANDRERVVQAHREAREALGDSVVEYRSVARDGRTVWLRDIIHIVPDREGGAERLRGVMIDITKEKALEEKLLESQKLEAVGQLAGGIAHEFNNLLTAMKGHTRFLLDDLPPGDPLRADAEEIEKAAERARDLTQHLLAVGQRQILQPRVLDLNRTVASLEPMLRRLLREDLDLSTSLSPDAGSVEVDPGQLEQVLVNLVLNARDAMPDGGRLSIGTSIAEVDSGEDQLDLSPGRYACLSVSDTGSGMDRETRDHLFEPFFTTKEQGEGAGLGLATVHGIVRQVRGDIAVRSAPGEGSTFRIYLPTSEHAPAAEEIAPERSDGRGANTVLVVEDEAVVRALVRRVLERKGYVVLEAENGLDALRVVAAAAEPVDLVVTDVVMPDMDGRRLVERLRDQRPDLPVIYMSGYTEDEVVRRGVAKGEPFLAKPFLPAELARHVREVLASQR